MKTSICAAKHAWLVTLPATLLAQPPQHAPVNNPFERPDDVVDLREEAAGPTAAMLPVLRATLTGGAVPYANIDGQIVPLGGTYLDYRVIAVDEGRAVIVNADTRLVLSVREDIATREAPR